MLADLARVVAKAGDSVPAETLARSITDPHGVGAVGVARVIGERGPPLRQRDPGTLKAGSSLKRLVATASLRDECHALISACADVLGAGRAGRSRFWRLPLMSRQVSEWIGRGC